MDTHHLPLTAAGTDRALLDKRLEDVGWGILLIMFGVIWAAPDEWVPPGTWLIGTGVLLLALNAVRRFKGIGVSGFTTVLGIVALLAGLSAVFGLKVPIFAICLIMFGAWLLFKAVVTRSS